MEHTLNPSTQEAVGSLMAEFKASLVYKVSSKTTGYYWIARATRRILISKTKAETKQTKMIAFLSSP